MSCNETLLQILAGLLAFALFAIPFWVLTSDWLTNRLYAKREKSKEKS